MIVRYRGRISRKQKGVALITVLLVFFIASLLATSLIDRQQLDIHRTENHLAQSQLYLNALSAEALAREILWEDFRQDGQNRRNNEDGERKDTLEEKWNEPAQLELERGSMAFYIEDLQSLFNLNSLVKTDDEVDPLAVEALREMMRDLGVGDPIGISESLVYRLENSGLVFSTAELRGFENVTSRDFSLIQPCIVALPQDAALNLNTASETLLKAWKHVIVPNQREDLLLERERNQGLSRLPGLPGGLSAFSINSEYFQVNIKAGFQGRELYLTSILFRNGKTGEISVIDRKLARPGFLEEPSCS